MEPGLPLSTGLGLPHPLGLALTRRSSPPAARRRHCGRPGHVQHDQQVGRRDLRHPGPGHPVRGVRLRYSDRRLAAPELGPGRQPRVPAESGPAARDGRPDRGVRASPAQGRRRGRPLPVGGGAGTAHAPAAQPDVISAAALVTGAMTERPLPGGSEQRWAGVWCSGSWPPAPGGRGRGVGRGAGCARSVRGRGCGRRPGCAGPEPGRGRWLRRARWPLRAR